MNPKTNSKSNQTALIELKDWKDVNNQLKKLADLTVQKRDLENKKTELIREITVKYDNEAAPIISEMDIIQKSIEAFTLEHKEEFVKSRTKELSHGTISLRVSTSIKVISKSICLRALHAMGMDEFIIKKEEPNKDMLRTLDDITLAKVACEKKTVDNISIEPKIEEINPESPIESPKAKEVSK
jgi:phage host-nuclease inhibitor protein Gam